MAQKKKAKPAKSKTSKKAPGKSASSKAKGPKYVYDFGKKTDGDATQRNLLGGKGALARGYHFSARLHAWIFGNTPGT